MDIFVSIAAFPIGLLVCFAPILLVWLKMELADGKKEKRNDRR
jgi:hypothetical protein